ncbi:MAG: MATE family efflux transporter, partial [Candidatus Krumholzibacteria bacterium]|nr:MATE family efflux transporter [Candidatus Krumholzibacteria bacterium]
SVIAPFVGQNWGAGAKERINLGIKYSTRFSMCWGIAIFIILALLARQIAALFSDNPLVISTTAAYLRIAPLGYGFLGVFIISISTLNVLNKPLHAAALSIMQMFVLYIPLAYVGVHLFGVPGIFWALAIAYIAAGIAAYFVLVRVMAKEKVISGKLI